MRQDALQMALLSSWGPQRGYGMGYWRASGFIGEWVLWVIILFDTVEMVKTLYIHTVVEIWRVDGTRAETWRQKKWDDPLTHLTHKPLSRRLFYPFSRTVYWFKWS